MPCCVGWTECIGVKSQVRTREQVLRKVMEEIREPQYRGYCIGTTSVHAPLLIHIQVHTCPHMYYINYYYYYYYVCMCAEHPAVCWL